MCYRVAGEVCSNGINFEFIPKPTDEEIKLRYGRATNPDSNTEIDQALVDLIFPDTGHTVCKPPCEKKQHGNAKNRRFDGKRGRGSSGAGTKGQTVRTRSIVRATL